MFITLYLLSIHFSCVYISMFIVRSLSLCLQLYLHCMFTLAVFISLYTFPFTLAVFTTLYTLSIHFSCVYISMFIVRSLSLCLQLYIHCMFTLAVFITLYMFSFFRSVHFSCVYISIHISVYFSGVYNSIFIVRSL